MTCQQPNGESREQRVSFRDRFNGVQATDQQPTVENREERVTFRIRGDESEKLDALCKAANRERSTLIRFLINDAYHRAIKRGSGTDETEPG